MNMTVDDRRKYARLSDWLEKGLASALARAAVRAPFLSYSKIAESDLDNVVALGTSMPWLKFDPLENIGPRGLDVNGMFDNTKSRWIFLAQAVAARFEQDFPDERIVRLVEATLLHELVHWGFHRHAGRPEPQEFGRAFEIAAYGNEISRYWQDFVPASQFVFPVTGRIGTLGTTWGAGVRSGGTRDHHGIDVFAAIGTPVHAAADGIVLAGNRYRDEPARLTEVGNYGRMLDIDHGNGLLTRYAHLGEVDVEPGSVRVGQRLGAVGASGTLYGRWYWGGQPAPGPPSDATAPHLHFEVRDAAGSPFKDFAATRDPAAYFDWIGAGAAAAQVKTRALAPGRSGTGAVVPVAVANGVGGSSITTRATGAAYPNALYAPTDPRGLRNNNPGNIKRTGDKWQGLVEEEDATDSVFFQFREMRWGIRAIARILRTYAGRGLGSLREIAATWAPSIDGNDSDAYAQTLLQYCDDHAHSVDDAIALSTDDTTLKAVIRGIVVAENGASQSVTVTDATIFEGDFSGEGVATGLAGDPLGEDPLCGYQPGH